MTRPNETILSGLPGINPLGFLAALGVQVALTEKGHDCALHWTDQPIPHPVLTPAIELEEIARCSIALAQDWLSGPALSTDLDEKLKLSAPEIRGFLGKGRLDVGSPALTYCLVAEDSLDKKGNAKPSNFVFTSGDEKFVKIARNILRRVTEENEKGIAAVCRDISETWRYEDQAKNMNITLRWDLAHDRQHALMASDPQGDKFTNLGSEFLAVLGLSRFPSFTGLRQVRTNTSNTLTVGWDGRRETAVFVWPLWQYPASVRSVDSLLAHVAPLKKNQGSQQQKSNYSKHVRKREVLYKGWGISCLLQAQVRRVKDRGTFGPARKIWQRD